MYKISVPIMLNNLDRGDRNEVLKMLHSLGAERVFLALDAYDLVIKKREKTFADLKRHTAFFKSEGFEVGAWTLTFVV
ncbi:MAG: hypothetical protein IJW55_10255 [Clostridia bacterium]|nr:hypothetical protein [Clostridia bacterium]MBQ7348330.1 hypothetical protein [Clostridia bacterium]